MKLLSGNASRWTKEVNMRYQVYWLFAVIKVGWGLQSKEGPGAAFGESPHCGLEEESGTLK